jgi:ADP-heptose:LPS heptosyltransferase
MDTIPKRMELFFRRKIQKFFFDESSTIVLNSARKTFELQKPLKVLFLRQDHLGDVVVSIPLIRELHEHFPSFELQIVLGKSNFSLSPFLKQYTTKEWKYSKKIFDTIRLILALRKERFDVVIDIHDKASLTSTILIWVIRSRYAVGLAHGASKVLTHRVEYIGKENPHVVDLYLLPLLAFGIDSKVVNSSLEFPKVSAVDKNPNRVLVNLNGSQRSRYWGTKHFISLISQIQSVYPQFEIVVSCTKDYENELQEILAQTGATHSGFFPTFLEFSLELEKSQFVITPDTVIPHICCAWNIPCVVMYLRKDSYEQWHPRNVLYKRLLAENEEMSSIQVNDVLTSFQQLVQSVSAN